MNKLMRKVVSVMALASFVMPLCGCDRNSVNSVDVFPITIMTSAAVGNSVTPDSPVKQKVEELTATKLDIKFIPSDSYPENLNTTLASGNLPMILYIDQNTPNIISAIRNDASWDITDYIKDYENLSKANPVVLNNMSIDGRVYGLYRGRNLGRFGYAYRKDWLENLGMSEPTTVDEFYNMLKAFTYNDPDGNGIDDTYGMTVTTSDITFNNFAVWNGAPNGWGFDENNKLIPAHLTEEYFETVKLFKKMADEGLINPDYIIMHAEGWNEPFINGKSGVILDTCDRAIPLEAELKKNNPSGKVGVAGVINNRVRPHLGYSGYFAFPKSSVKDEETLKNLLQFMDDCCDGEVFDLMRYGIEGRHYDMIDGFIQQRTGADVPRNEINDFNQVLTFIGQEDGTKLVQTDMQKEVARVQKDNEQYAVANPAEALISETYAKKGTELDKVINDA
ncbi:MAG: extracellular solute-binding protein, partial [Clostridia bacterium]|nr:extracellular solute-binding protein [Clostridia bacterium]